MVSLSVWLEVRQCVYNRQVYAVGSGAAAENEQMEILHWSASWRIHRCQNLPPHRIAGQQCLPLGEEFFGFAQGYENLLGNAGKNFIGHAGDRILLVYKTTDLHSSCSQHHRSRSVAADAEHQVGTETLQDLPRLGVCIQEHCHPLQL